jgi:anti-anti-sigma regulatory factor
MPEQKWQFEQDGLAINASRVNGTGKVAWCGVSDSRTPALFLRPVLRELSEKMKGAEVTVDFTKLEYMNSATVAPLINFVKTLDAACARILVLFSDADWQRTHLQCMRAIATTLRHVAVQSAPASAA